MLYYQSSGESFFSRACRTNIRAILYFPGIKSDLIFTFLGYVFTFAENDSPIGVNKRDDHLFPRQECTGGYFKGLKLKSTGSLP
jgi:hypothetical protein